MIARAAVVAEALTWLKTPYHHEGDVKGVGVDCAMILVRVFAAPTVALIPADFDPRPYSQDWMLHREEEKYLGWLMQFADRVDAPKAADVVIWRFGRTFSHAAIVTDERGGMIHAYRQDRSVVLGRLDETALLDRERQVWRVRGIEGAP